MTNNAILAFSALLVFACLLDVFGRRARLPPVVCGFHGMSGHDSTACRAMLGHNA